MLESAGLWDVLCWDHRVTAQEWWSGPAARVAFTGQLIQSQPPAVRAEIRRFFDEFAGEDGLLTLPHAALLARARR